MKKLVYIFTLLVVGSLMIASCGGNGNSNGTEEDSTKIVIVSADSFVVPPISEVVGILGDGTTMNVLEVVSAENDTIYVECSDNLVMGGVNVGDRIALTYNSSESGDIAMTCINMTALEHLWGQVRGDGHKQSLEIDEGGNATTYDMTVEYDKWSLKDGQLILHSPKKVTSEESAISDTFDIMELTDERLVLMHGDLETEFVREN